MTPHLIEIDVKKRNEKKMFQYTVFLTCQSSIAGDLAYVFSKLKNGKLREYVVTSPDDAMKLIKQ